MGCQDKAIAIEKKYILLHILYINFLNFHFIFLLNLSTDEHFSQAELPEIWLHAKRLPVLRATMVFHGFKHFLGITAVVGWHGTAALKLQNALSIGGTDRRILFGTRIVAFILGHIRINPFAVLVNAQAIAVWSGNHFSGSISDVGCKNSLY